MILFDQYVPVLKWRQGEYQALLRLSDDIKSQIVPLIVIPPIEYDFEEERQKHNIDQHLEKFSQRVSAKWEDRLALVDLHSSLDEEVMSSGESSIRYVLNSLEANSCKYVPVISLSKSKEYLRDVKMSLQYTGGVAFRLSLAEIAHPDINAQMKKTIQGLGIEYDYVDLIIDLARPDTFMPYNKFGKLLQHYVRKIVHLKNFRSFVLIGTSLNLSEVKKPGGEFERQEWLFFRELVELGGNDGQVPSYGDYAIETPAFQDIDFRMMKPAGKIVYTCEDTWLISKGGAFRDNPSQMVGHCIQVKSSPHYCGKNYSWGDWKIDEISQNKTSNYGQLSTWKQVGTNHHLTRVVRQLSNYFGS